MEATTLLREEQTINESLKLYREGMASQTKRYIILFSEQQIFERGKALPVPSLPQCGEEGEAIEHVMK